MGDPAQMAMVVVITASGSLLPPPPQTSGPFARSDADRLQTLAADAGLVAKAIFDVTDIVRYPDIATALRRLNASGVAARAINHAREAAVSEVPRAAPAPFRCAGESYAVSSAFRCMIATVRG